MKLGTIVYEDKIYNLDYMSSEEVSSLLKKVSSDKKQNMMKGKNLLKDKK